MSNDPSAQAKTGGMSVIYPAQCSCGHLYLERYKLAEPTSAGAVGFCWCGWCRKKRLVFPNEPKNAENAMIAERAGKE